MTQGLTNQEIALQLTLKLMDKAERALPLEENISGPAAPANFTPVRAFKAYKTILKGLESKE